MAENSDDIDALYREILGRERDKTEIGSEEENAGKYGMDSIRRNLEERKVNVPGGERESEMQVHRSDSQSPSQSWNSQPVDPYPSWYKDLMTQQVTMQQEQQRQAKEKSDALYSTLNTRASQGLQVNAADPIIKGQVDAFTAAGERSRRNYLSDTAERSGPYANLRGEQRMTAEKLGQGTSGFQAELIGRELGARRDEIAQALAMQGGMLSADQQRNLQMQLATMDQAIKEAGVGLQGRGLDLQRDLGFADLNLRDKLGTGQLALGNRGLDLSNDQFLRELGLREWDLGQKWDFNWAGL